MGWLGFSVAVLKVSHTEGGTGRVFSVADGRLNLNDACLVL
jgi:hypothetical protein